MRACAPCLSAKKAFILPYVGLPPALAIVRLNELVGRQQAKHLSMLGEPISAQDAVVIGLALEVVGHDELMDKAIALAGKLAKKPQMAIRYAKSAYNRELGGGELTYAKDVMPFLFLDDDAREGVAAFREKRKPVFK